MPAGLPFRLGLVVRSEAYAQRSARSQLDLAVLAASLDIDLHLYFCGPAVLQLLSTFQPQQALLPPGYRAWGSLPGLIESASLHSWAEPEWLDRLLASGLAMSLQVQPMEAAAMRRDWSACDRVMLL